MFLAVVFFACQDEGGGRGWINTPLWNKSLFAVEAKVNIDPQVGCHCDLVPTTPNIPCAHMGCTICHCPHVQNLQDKRFQVCATPAGSRQGVPDRKVGVLLDMGPGDFPNG